MAKKAEQNRQYKDSVFVDLFSNDKTAHANFISLYNALHNTNLPLTTELELQKLEQVLYMSFYNDVSFVVDNKIIVLTEHQSTVNQKMPLRFLEYIARIYEKLHDTKEKYRKKQIKLPTPEFYVFYNGLEDYPEETTLKLSDAFILEPETPNLEIIVRVVNINTNKHNIILSKCEPIKEYSQFIDIVREFDKKSTEGDEKNIEGKKSDKETSYTQAIKYCIDNNILKDYLKRKSKEVLNMLLAEYSYATDIEVQREEAKEEGISLGITQGAYEKAIETARNCLSIGLTREQTATISGLPLSDLKSIEDDL